MKELVEVIAKSLVDNPDEVAVTERDSLAKTTVVELKVAPSDMGKVIGKQGRIAKAIRAVVKAAASKEDKKVVVDILQLNESVPKQDAAFEADTLACRDEQVLDFIQIFEHRRRNMERIFAGRGALPQHMVFAEKSKYFRQRMM